MSSSTWNFPTYQCIDNLSVSASVRATGGSLFKVGPGNVFQSPPTTQPFTNTLTGIFSFLIRSGWTNQNNSTDIQGVFSIGKRAGGTFLQIYFLSASNNPAMAVVFKDAGGTTRYNYVFYDDDGSSNLKDDKWYQLGISATTSGFTFALNGTTTPKVTVNTNNPGNLNLDDGTERIWVHGPSASTDTNLPSQITFPAWSSLLLGPSCWSTQSLDFSSSAVRARIWDDDGDFKNPGEDGSLWFGDTYAGNQPEYYFVDGSPIIQNGSETDEWSSSTSIAIVGVGAGLRKQYES